VTIATAAIDEGPWTVIDHRDAVQTGQHGAREAFVRARRS
jgi:hypothetical protein